MKYFYKKEYWGDYCKRNNIDYKCAYKMYIYYKNKYKDTYSNDKLMEYVVEKQKLLKSKKRLIKYFRLLNDESNLIDYKEICEVLKINYNRVQILSRSRYSKNFVIKSIWIFSDLETDGLKTISLKKWREVKNFMKIQSINLKK